MGMGKKRGAVQLGNSRDFLAVSMVATVIILTYEVLSLTPARTPWLQLEHEPDLLPFLSLPMDLILINCLDFSLK